METLEQTVLTLCLSRISEFVYHLNWTIDEENIYKAYTGTG
jgi:hypothetical protein